ncbi:MAG: efflux RND transporter periplasmic adaptor subunit [Planctomycetes bacterium]|nr:efflux RND transporter periplasmic adaptor subunit [Planctomycetota bacterium]
MIARIAKWTAVVTVAVVGLFVWWTWSAPVEVVEPRRGGIVAEAMGTGTLEARVATTISPKIAGRIQQVLADQGERVAAGALLVQLDDEELRQQVAIAEANVETAQAAAARFRADKERASTIFEQATRHEGRIKSLQERGAATVEDLERASESLSVASADLARAEAAITESEKARASAEKSLEYQRARLRDTRIEAPFDGLIIERRREAGDVVVPGSSVLTVVSTDVLWIRAWVDETEMARIAVGQPARVVFRSEPGKAYDGKVVRLGRQSDRESREFVAEVEVARLPGNWAIGQRAEVFIETARRADCLLAPSRTVVFSLEGAGVFVDDDGIARWRPVKTGLRGRDTIEIIEGLDESDRLIEAPAGSSPLSDGKRVRPR